MFLEFEYWNEIASFLAKTSKTSKYIVSKIWKIYFKNDNWNRGKNKSSYETEFAWGIEVDSPQPDEGSARTRNG